MNNCVYFTVAQVDTSVQELYKRSNFSGFIYSEILDIFIN